MEKPGEVPCPAHFDTAPWGTVSSSTNRSTLSKRRAVAGRTPKPEEVRPALCRFRVVAVREVDSRRPADLLSRGGVKQPKRVARVEGENNLRRLPEVWLTVGAAWLVEAQADASVVRVLARCQAWLLWLPMKAMVTRAGPLPERDPVWKSA
jgi:hypothetical protein